MKFRFLNSGESHGKKLTAIIDNVPANFDIDIEQINKELARRQQGYGRGARMQIEKDKVEISSGIRFGKTIGSPICLEIINKDFEKWENAMNPYFEKENIDKKEFFSLRPGHADYPGIIKYAQEDIRNILERSSARETAIKVAVGAIAKQFLEKFDIKINSYVMSIGTIEVENINLEIKNDLNCPNANAYERMKQEIDKAKESGITLGGTIQIRIQNSPIGLGSHTHWDRKLDGLLAQALMSIQAVKSVEIGLGKKSAYLSGDKVHDEILLNPENKIYHKTNNAGGIEGGMSNGEEIIATIGMKPIPTMKSPLSSININDLSTTSAHFERSDTCAVASCGVVAESMCAIIILQQFLEKFGGDSFDEIKTNFNNYTQYNILRGK